MVRLTVLYKADTSYVLSIVESAETGLILYTVRKGTDDTTFLTWSVYSDVT